MMRWIWLFIPWLIVSPCFAGQGMGPGPGISRVSVVAPDAPTMSSVSNSPAQITATWGTSAGATSYNLYLRAGAAPTTSVYDQKITNTVSPYTWISGLTSGTTYYAGATAVNGAGESSISNTSSAVAATAVAVINNSSFESAYNTGTDWTTVTGPPEPICGEGSDPCGSATSTRSNGALTPSDGSWYHLNQVMVNAGSGGQTSSAYVKQTMTGSSLRGATGTLSFDAACNVANLGSSSGVVLLVSFIAYEGAININGSNRFTTVFGGAAPYAGQSLSNANSYTANAWHSKSFDFKTWVSNHLTAGKTINDITTIDILFYGYTELEDSTTYNFYVDKVVYQ